MATVGLVDVSVVVRILLDPVFGGNEINPVVVSWRCLVVVGEGMLR